MPSRGLAAWEAATSTTVSPERTTTEPWACFASLPVSNEIVRDPIRTSRFCRFTLCIGESRLMAGLGPRGSGFDSVESRLPNPEPRRLLANAEASNQLGVPIGILALEIIEQTPPLADQLQQSAARMMILCVDLEVLGEVIDPVAENRDLHFRRSGVAVVRPVAADDPGLAVLVQRHVSSSTNGPELATLKVREFLPFDLKRSAQSAVTTDPVNS